MTTISNFNPASYQVRSNNTNSNSRLNNQKSSLGFGMNKSEVIGKTKDVAIGVVEEVGGFVGTAIGANMLTYPANTISTVGGLYLTIVGPYFMMDGGMRILLSKGARKEFGNAVKAFFKENPMPKLLPSIKGNGK